MSLDIHRQAELLMGQADRLAIQGRMKEAAALYRDAGIAEAHAFELIPEERRKTRGIVAVSSVALFRKAGALDEAIRHAHAFLGRTDLPDFARDDLDRLLDEMKFERSVLLDGRSLLPGSYEWILRGPGVGAGMARLSTVAQKIDQVARYAVRVYEYLAGLPVRMAGPVSPEVRRAFDVIVSEPVAGSFRFCVRFTVPARQLPLFDMVEPVRPEQIGETFGAILDTGSRAGTDALGEIVADQTYQDAFLR
ncbi:MAG: hypothetical protein IT307_13450, partial [Chloroflexi bacterium]|nr:hypothetical protein [Chloroflexota bacterium]